MSDTQAWLDRHEPLDELAHAAQLETLLEWLGSSPKRVLEIGAGGGRIVRPLAMAGHHVTAVDVDAFDPADFEELTDEARTNITFMQADVRDASTWSSFDDATDSFDAVFCIGNTFMLFADVDEAVALLARAGDVCGANAFVAIDDIPLDFWPEVAEGNWANGTAADDSMQLVWDASDAVFALRHGAAVDASSDTLRADDQRLRLWTDGMIRLVARQAGLSAPERGEGTHLLRMIPATPSREARGGVAGGGSG